MQARDGHRLQRDLGLCNADCVSCPKRRNLYIVKRPGNATPSSEAGPWIDRAIDQVGDVFEKVWLRGDTHFSLTGHLDKWDRRVSFVLGHDTYANLLERTEALPGKAWHTGSSSSLPGPDRIRPRERFRFKIHVSVSAAGLRNK